MGTSESVFLETQDTNQETGLCEILQCWVGSTTVDLSAIYGREISLLPNAKLVYKLRNRKCFEEYINENLTFHTNILLKSLWYDKEDEDIFYIPKFSYSRKVPQSLFPIPR